MNQTLKQLGLAGVIPVVVIENDLNAVPLMKALVDGGLHTMEVTFRTDAAPAALRSLASAYHDEVLGAGTVTTIDQVKVAVDAGAKFIVSPGLQVRVCEYCLNHDIPIIPGVVTPTEIALAQELGLQVVKFFPAEASGGLTYLKAVSAPFRGIDFIPTGGIDAGNMLSYLSFPRVHACGGSWMVRADLIASQSFEQISLMTRNAVAAMLDFSILCGLHELPPAEAIQEQIASVSARFRLPVSSVEDKAGCESAIEVLRSHDAVTPTPLLVKTRFLDRAVFFCSRQGISLRGDIQLERGGRVAFAVLELEVGGRSIVLVELN